MESLLASRGTGAPDMLAQLCDLPFSGGSIGPVLVAGALAVLAGAVILVLQRRARRPVAPLALVALLVPAAVLLAFATGSADAGAFTTRSMTAGQDPACGGTSEFSSTTSSTTTITSGPAWSTVKVLASVATRPSTVAPTTPPPTSPPSTPAPTPPATTTPPTTVEPTTTSTTSTSTSTTTTSTSTTTTSTSTTSSTSTTIAPSTTAGVTTTSYEDIGTDDTAPEGFASNLADVAGDAELQTAVASPESSMVADDAA